MKKTILFSSAGRRNQLIGCFRQDARELGIDLRVLAADLNPRLSPACHAADAAFSVSRCTHPEFVEEMLSLCRREEVDLVIPTIDTELPAFASNSERFDAINTRVVVSSPAVVALARDKMATARHLESIGMPSPRTVWWRELREEPTLLRWPVILKPNDGSASQGVIRLREPGLGGGVPDTRELIAQECLQGAEFTVNMFFDQDGGLRCAIPHERLEVRAGEVSKGVTRRMPALAEAARMLAPRLAGARGPLCFQAVVDSSGAHWVFEINARFGGGFPLAHHARAQFSRWLLEEALGASCTANDEWRDGVIMLRYDSAEFIDA
jgi:carbamoyl-phosphate synthase large subunit